MNEQQNITDELVEIGSALAFQDSKLPYVVPEGYFNNLADDLFTTVQEESGRLPKPSLPYLLSDSYFNELPYLILNRAQGVPTQPLRVTFSPYPNIRVAIAAVLIAIISLGSYISFIAVQSHDTEVLLSRVEGSDISYYLQRTYNISASDNKNGAMLDLMVDEKEITEYFNATGWE